MVNFQDWIFEKLPMRFRDEDTYKVGGKGLFQRFIEAHGHDLDTYITPKIGTLSDLNTVLTVDEVYVTYIALLLGNPPDTFYDEAKYRKLLRYIMDINKVKGTALSYELIFGILGITVTITEHPVSEYRYDSGMIYDNNARYDSSCPPCSGYDLELVYPEDMAIVGTWETDPLIEALLLAYIAYVEPINARIITFAAEPGGIIPPVEALIKLGLLYNYPAIVDARKITSSDTWRVTSSLDWKALLLSLGGIDYVSFVRSEDPDEFGQFTLGNHYPLCDTNTDYWTTFTGMTNTLNFNFRGSGSRQVVYDEETEITSVSYSLLGVYGYCLNTDDVIGYKESVFFIRNIYALVWVLNDLITIVKNRSGYPIRLVRPATEAELLLDDGTACADYISNDNFAYRTVKMGPLVWLADNLAEKKYRNGDDIPEVTDNSAWIALTTGALCAYENDWSNVFI